MYSFGVPVVRKRAMLAENIQLKPGMPVASPGGRRLEIEDVFVPRNDQGRSRSLPAAFRYLPRKVVVFRDGSVASLAEVKRGFKILER
jgi:hypothetical protein